MAHSHRGLRASNRTLSRNDGTRADYAVAKAQRESNRPNFWTLAHQRQRDDEVPALAENQFIRRGREVGHKL
eukprot:scaffold47_cov258-Pinguiococcus_pyrenoidosus.AAC.83